MAWIWSQTGVRYREHKTRMHGIRPDRYYSIRYKVNGKEIEEGCGWSSKGVTAKKADKKRKEMIEAHIESGAETLKERREIESAQREVERIARELAEKENVTFADYFNSVYMPIAQTHKTDKTIYTEMLIFKNWLSPAVGHIPLKDISAFHIEKFKKAQINKGLTSRSVQHTIAIFRHVWYEARRSGHVTGDCPTVHVKTPRVDNRRMRFLTRDEAAQLLEALQPISQQVHDMALLSMNTGMRAGEVFSLSWGRVDMVRGQIQIVDTKSKRNRVAYMTDVVKAMFTRLHGKAQDVNALVFPDTRGRRAVSISKTFGRTVEALGFNNAIVDSRQRVVFHSLRHTFASWLVENGTDLYTVKELLGHASITLTERYSHLSENTLKAAVKRLEEAAHNG